MFSSRKKKTPSAKSERHVPSPESNSRGFLPNLSTQIAATTVPATYKLKIMSALSTAEAELGAAAKYPGMGFRKPDWMG